MDVDSRTQVARLVDQLTTAGGKDLDKIKLKELKTSVRSDDQLIHHVFYLLMTQLEKDHAEIRRSALYIIDELFRRSHLFRTLLLEDLQTFLEQTIGTDLDNPLPPPSAVANDLKDTALRVLKEWYRQFRSGYRTLAIAYDYLVDRRKIQEDPTRPGNTRLDRRRRERFESVKVREILEEYEKTGELMKSNLIELENCSRILVASVNPIFAGDGDQAPGPSRPKDPSGIHRVHGIPLNYSITIEVKSEVKIYETPENSVIIENFREIRDLMMKKHLPLIRKWLKILSKCHGVPEDKLKSLIDLKESIEAWDSKLNDLKIEPAVRTSGQGGDSSDEEDDFVEVEETIPHDMIPPELRSEFGLEPESEKPAETTKRNVLEEHIDPTSRAAQYKKIFERFSRNDRRKRQVESKASFRSAETANKKVRMGRNAPGGEEKLSEGATTASSEKEGATSRKEKLLKEAPRVNFDIDLIHWEDEKLEDAVQIIPIECHKVKARDDDQISELQRQAGIAMLRERKIDFSGKFEAVKWSCRAPLAPGKLCPRKDRFKCPFHGEIIARDEQGCPRDTAIAASEATTSGNMKDELHWQDPQLLREIEVATGIDLRMPVKGKRNPSKKTQLTDLKKAENTARSRLEKKVLNKSSMMRVAAQLDSIDSRKYDDKFGDQWNYS